MTASALTAGAVTQLSVDRFRYDITLNNPLGVKGYIEISMASLSMPLGNAVMDYQILLPTSASVGGGTLIF